MISTIDHQRCCDLRTLFAYSLLFTQLAFQSRWGSTLQVSAIVTLPPSTENKFLRVSASGTGHAFSIVVQA
jgi:hypothetical protein